jgi:hypothetical protein
MKNALSAEEPDPDIDGVVDPEALRAYVKDLLSQVRNQSTHPTVLNGESVDQILKDTEKYKKECQQAEKKLSDLRVQKEVQKRARERVGGADSRHAF